MTRFPQEVFEAFLDEQNSQNVYSRHKACKNRIQRKALGNDRSNLETECEMGESGSGAPKHGKLRQFDVNDEAQEKERNLKNGGCARRVRRV